MELERDFMSVPMGSSVMSEEGLVRFLNDRGHEALPDHVCIFKEMCILYLSINI
jgi:hypothetical protein